VGAEPPAQPLQASFNPAGGSIGRGGDNDWVLPDPQRYVSGRHALISYADSCYLVTDVSSNGVYLNHAETPLGRDTQATLQQGDILTIGEYDIRVSLQQPVDEATDANSLDSLEDPYARLRDEHAGIHLEQDHQPIASDPEPVSESMFTLDDPARPELDEDIAALSMAPADSSESDHVSDLNSFFSGPALIPEDWQAEEKPPAPSSTPLAQAGEATGQQAQPAPAPSTDKAHAPRDLRDGPAAAEQPAPKPTAAKSEEALREALARGMGLSRTLFDEMPLEQTLENLGRILRSNIEGTMSILRARAQMKSEFRMSQTMIRPVENNPLKFSVNTEEALRQIIDPRPNSGYLSPLAAIREAHEDTEAHMLAVMVGMQSALKAVLLRFKPENLEQRLEQQALLDKVPLYRRAKSWQLFNELYSEIACEVEDDFQQVFGRTFSQAYESQVRRLENLKNDHPATTTQNRN
jgi:type VI secretion system protein